MSSESCRRMEMRKAAQQNEHSARCEEKNTTNALHEIDSSHL
jgi:hypothetical protein